MHKLVVAVVRLVMDLVMDLVPVMNGLWLMLMMKLYWQSNFGQNIHTWRQVIRPCTG